MTGSGVCGVSIPVGQQDVERALRPWLGSAIVNNEPLCGELAWRLMQYAPYRQTLESLRDEVESGLITSLHRITRGTMIVMRDNGHSARLGLEDMRAMTDDAMGVVFDKLTPFSANFIKLNDYSLRVQSLSALRVLCQRYATYYTDEQLWFMKRMIRTIYPPRLYESWLRD